ncbi:MAG: hypothetical protein KDC28_17830 [Saprospiraceae bacterium]|nr:hypothetical protein [Saprospiraceae bacterium]MCB9320581.1 hypothetical protein [Lewinellaceae bacterium]
MNIIQDYQMIGLNHHRSDFRVRGAVSLHGEQRKTFYRQAQKSGFTGFVLSTCNRTEIYFSATTYDEVLRIWKKCCPEAKFSRNCLIHLSGPDMLNHLYEVACGLDARVPGDNEILGQLKEAVSEAREAKLLPGIWQKITNSAISCSRKIRNSTHFNSGTTSIPYTISKRIRICAGKSPKILVLGTGAMATLCIKYINNHLPDRELAIASRCPEKARRMASECGGDAVLLPADNADFARYDAVISALQLDRPQYEIPHGKSLIFDLGIPANFKTEVHSDRYQHLDWLAAGVKITLGCRSGEVLKVRRIIQEYLQAWDEWEEQRKRVTGQLNLMACSRSA